MDFRQLRYFIAIVDSGSLSKASRQLHIVQPALSQRLSDLEGEVGVQLLVRGPQGVALTPAGDELYQRAQLIMKQLDAARAAVREHVGGIGGIVQIGLLRTTAPSVAPRLFRMLAEEFPRIVPQMRVGYSADLSQLLRAGKLDLAMQVLSPADRSRRGPPLYSEGLCLVGPRRLVPDTVSIRLPELSGVPLLLSSMQPNYSSILHAAGAAGVSLHVIGGIEDSAAVLDVCESGLAATILPESSALSHTSGRALAFAVLDEPTLRRDIVLSLQPDVPTTGAVLAVQVVLSRLLAGFGEQSDRSTDSKTSAAVEGEDRLKRSARLLRTHSGFSAEPPPKSKE